MVNEKAAQELDIPYTTYISYEKFDNKDVCREPNSETLIRIADFYGVTVDYLIGKSDYKKGYYQPSADEELKFALFDGANVEVTDEMYDEVKRFAAFVAMREQDKRKE